MRADELKFLIRKQPFEPMELALSDGRVVRIRHPDQVVVSARHAIFGLAHVRRMNGPFRTPADGDSVATDWLLVDLVHVVSAEPVARPPKPRRRKRSA